MAIAKFFQWQRAYLGEIKCGPQVRSQPHIKRSVYGVSSPPSNNFLAENKPSHKLFITYFVRLLRILKTVINFTAQTVKQKPGQGKAGGSADIIESVYPR